jgi:hypothetical protein
MVVMNFIPHNIEEIPASRMLKISRKKDPPNSQL